MEYQTAHLLVRRLREEDREAIIQLLTDPIVTKTYMVPDCSEAGKAEALFDRLMELSHRADRYVSAIVLEDRLIGLLNETEVSERSIELGYAILPAYHNCGYGTEVLQGAIAYLFAHGFTRVVTGAFSENHPSLRIMEKCGMTRQVQTDTVEYRGEKHLCVYYAAERPYYEAYDDRYRQVHSQNLQWFAETPSPIVHAVIKEFGLTQTHTMLELGCGEGRDASFLLRQGYNVTATDISPEAIRFCREKYGCYVNSFSELDCVSGYWSERYDFIYAVAVVHMLVNDADRNGFYAFIRTHLKKDGLALICTMGDGVQERQSDIRTAFQLQTRVHEQTGASLCIAGTSCRVVSFQSFEEELLRNGLVSVKQGMTAVEPDFPVMMYAVVQLA